jgi:gamma-glutamyltranspeptidase/glutathione hydrolase
LQIITNVIDYEMDIGLAVDAGRFHHQWMPDQISIEKAALNSTTIVQLNRIGHVIRERSLIGRVNAIHILPDGRLKAGADWRGVNSAIGY